MLFPASTTVVEAEHLPSLHLSWDICAIKKRRSNRSPHRTLFQTSVKNPWRWKWLERYGILVGNVGTKLETSKDSNVPKRRLSSLTAGFDSPSDKLYSKGNKPTEAFALAAAADKSDARLWYSCPSREDLDRCCRIFHWWTKFPPALDVGKRLLGRNFQPFYPPFASKNGDMILPGSSAFNVNFKAFCW